MNRSNFHAAGFTLVEMMVAVSLSAILVLMAMSAFIFQRRVLHANQLVSEMRQNVRACMDMVNRDLRAAGYGLDMEQSELAAWIDWCADLDGNPIAFDSNPKVLNGASGAPDSLWIAAAFDPPIASLASAAAAGGTTVQLGTGEGAQFNVTDRKIVFLGRRETARVTAIAGDTLTISTHPGRLVGLDRDYPVGTPVELIAVRSYEQQAETTAYPQAPHVTRDNNQATGFSYSWQRLIATHVEDLQFGQNGNQVAINVTGRASVKDYTYGTRGGGDGYRRSTLTSSAFARNLRP